MRSLFLLFLWLCGSSSRAQSDVGAEGTTIHPLSAESRAVLEGFVQTPDGGAAQGALVVSSAGGRSVTGADGSFRLEVALPREARTIELTALQGSGAASAVGHGSVTLAGLGRVTSGVVLTLGAGSCSPAWLPTFGERPGLGGPVSSFAVFDDGSGPRLVACGSFNDVGGVQTHIAGWDGARWSALVPGGPLLEVLVVFDDGSGPALYAGSSSDHIGVRRLVGSSWTTLAGLTGSFNAMLAFQEKSGPALYVAGRLALTGGTLAERIARWDGQSWSLVAGVFDDEVLALASFDDGDGPELVAGGAFTHVGGAPADRIARWDGATWSPLGTGIGGMTVTVEVHALLAFDDGQGPALFAGGLFGSAGGVSARNVARWDGSGWSALGDGPAGRVFALAALDSGGGPVLHAAGRSASGAPEDRVVRWDGNSWSPLGAGLDDDVHALAVFDDGSGTRLFAGGDFLSTGGVPALRAARWNGSSWTALGWGFNGDVFALELFDDGSGGGACLFAAGDFTYADGVALDRIARWNGSSWAPVGGGTNGKVYALAVFDDGGGEALYAAGDFTQAGGVAAQRIARWDGSTWTPLGAGLNVEVRALTSDDDWLYAGGLFTTSGGTPLAHVARWNGSVWSALGSGRPDSIYALEILDDGSGPALYAGGRFRTGTMSNAVARWNGSSWSALTGLVRPIDEPGFVYDLTTFDAGSGNGPELYAGGRFRVSNGGGNANFARWDGADWSSPLGEGLGITESVYALEVFDEGGDAPALFVGGSFQIAPIASGLVRWDGTSFSTVGGHAWGHVRALATLDLGLGPALILGGTFLQSVAGDSYVARWQGCADVVPPTIHAPQRLVVLDPLSTPPGELVTFTVTASDEQDPAPVLVCSPPSGSFFPRGTTIVTCTATDAAGNQATSHFPLTVAPKARPR